MGNAESIAVYDICLEVESSLDFINLKKRARRMDIVIVIKDSPTKTPVPPGMTVLIVPMPTTWEAIPATIKLAALRLENIAKEKGYAEFGYQ
jgi:hypothetical protein